MLVRGIGYMKDLASLHREEISRYTNIDWDVVSSLSYLYQFDREFQYANSSYM